MQDETYSTHLSKETARAAQGWKMLGCCWKQRREAAGAQKQEWSEDSTASAQEQLTAVPPTSQAER
jgi:hypothetical protein